MSDIYVEQELVQVSYDDVNFNQVLNKTKHKLKDYDYKNPLNDFVHCLI